VLYGTLGDTLAESAARFNHCGGQETGIMMLVPILIRPYAECGGLLSLAYDGQNSVRIELTWFPIHVMT